MAFQYSENENPGYLLQTLLMDIYPLDGISDKSFIQRLDHDLRADGELILVIYKSSINYLVRRLIRTAQYIRELPGNNSDIRYFEELREFLQNELSLPKGKTEAIFTLVSKCVTVSQKVPTQKTKDRIVRNARENNQKCYICGGDLNFSEPNQDNSVEVEHLWPRSLGGESNDSNLVACCRKCNQAKHDFLDATDFHFEEMTYKADDFPGENTLRDREHRVALWAKNNYVCNHGRCKTSPAQSGEFLFEKKNSRDGWHYLNIDAYCPQHHSK